MRTLQQRTAALPVVFATLTVLVACQADSRLTTEPDGRLRAVAAAMTPGGSGDEHEETDPRIPPVCHGLTATLWYNMPSDLIPRGAIVRPVVRGGDESHVDRVVVSVGEAADDTEVSGYFITGTTNRDVIVGSPQRDSIAGGNGDDVICADPVRGGEDGTVHAPGQGGGGPDIVSGDNGNDTIYGGGGPDSLYGGNGDDTLVGGGGPDALYGENGNDVLDGGVGPDLLDGGRGNDRLTGGGGNDTLLGGSGDDVLLGGAGFDVLDGGGGGDVLDPGDQVEVPDDHTDPHETPMGG